MTMIPSIRHFLLAFVGLRVRYTLCSGREDPEPSENRGGGEKILFRRPWI